MVGEVLIADGVATNRIVLKTKLAMSCYAVTGAPDCTSVISSLRDCRRRLLVIDADLPQGEDPNAPSNGIAACSALKAAPETATLPIILTYEARSASERQDLRRAAKLAGADAILEKPIEDALLMARVRSLLRNRDIAEELALRETTSQALGFSETGINYESAGRIALVAQHLDDAIALRRNLEPHLSHNLVALTPGRAMTDETGPAPDIYVALILPGQHPETLRLMSELRSRERSRHASVIVVMRERNADAAATALDLGAVDVLQSPLDTQELALSLTAQMRHKRRADRLRQQVRTGLQLAVCDPLTGLFNRRYALSHLSRIEERALQSGRPYAVMMLDLDRFKRVNDEHGHLAGDAVLKAVAERINANLRGLDMVARIGGEEFLVVMPETDARAARAAAARLCSTLKDEPIVLPGGGGSITQTVSIGVALGGVAGQNSNPAEVIDRADRALLSAKSRGRNTVQLVSTAA